MQELDVLRKIDSPTVEVIMHLGGVDEEIPVDVQIHRMCTIQISVVVDDVTP
jgi:hypothetical protein